MLVRAPLASSLTLIGTFPSCFKEFCNKFSSLTQRHVTLDDKKSFWRYSLNLVI